MRYAADQYSLVSLTSALHLGGTLPNKSLLLCQPKKTKTKKPTSSKGFSLHRDKIQTSKSTSRMIWLQYPYSICPLFTPSQTHLSSGNCTCTLLFIHPSSNLCMVACLLVIVQFPAYTCESASEWPSPDKHGQSRTPPHNASTLPK